MGRKPVIERHMPKEELEQLYRNEKDVRIKERLLAVIQVYEGKNIYELVSMLKRSKRTIIYWLGRWNKGGYEGLIPQKGGGKKPRLPPEEWDDILEEVDGKGMTIKEVKDYVKSSRGIEYSYKRVWSILRVEKKVKYGKPYTKNSKRPKDAERILKKDRVGHVNNQ